MVAVTEEETMEVAPEEVTTSEKETEIETPPTENLSKLKEPLAEPVTTSEDTTPQEEMKTDTATTDAADSAEVDSKTDVEEKQEQEEPKSEESKSEESKSEGAKTEETTEDIVAKFEEEFKERYTENDAAHKAVQEMKEASPPVVANFGYGSHKDSSSSSSRTSREERSSSNKRTRSRSRSKSPSGPPLKRKGAFGCYSYFVFYY